MRKALRLSLWLVGAVGALGLIGGLLVSLAIATNISMGTKIPDGFATCPVEDMSVKHSRNAPARVEWVKLYCDDGPWGFVHLSATRSDIWNQPQEALDKSDTRSAFACARHKQMKLTGEFAFYAYGPCRPAP